MGWAVGDTITHTATFRNADGTPVTGKVANISAYLKRAKDRSNNVISFPTLSSYAEVASSGTYEATFVAATAGKYYIVTRYSENGQPIQDYDESFTVDVATERDAAGALDGTLAAIQARTDRIGSGVEIAVSPVAVNGDVSLIAGDETTIPWDYIGPEDLTAATATFQAYKLLTDAAVFASAKSVTITDAGEATQHLSITLSTTDTDDFTPGVAYRYEVNSTVGLLAAGQLSVRES